MIQTSLPNSRKALTLIELVAAMAASTLLLVALASTVVVATKLIEAPKADAEKIETSEVIGLIGTDLRFADSVAQPQANRIEITRTNLAGNSTEAIVYETGVAGLSRSVNDSDPISILPDATSMTWTPEIETGVSNRTAPKIVGFTKAASTSNTSLLTVDVPAGLVPGDLILVAACCRGKRTLSCDGMTWTTQSNYCPSDIRCLVTTAPFTSTTPSQFNVIASRDCRLLAIAIGITGQAPTTPVAAVSNHTGSTFNIFAPSRATPASIPGIKRSDISLQVFALSGSPLEDYGLGLATFNDVTQCTSHSALFQPSVSLGVAWRYGPLPPQLVAPRVDSSGTTWTTSALQLVGKE